MRSTILAISLAFSSAVSAQTITIPADGSLFCENTEHMMKIVMAALVGQKPDKFDSCIVLRGGTKIAASKVEKMASGAFDLGVGTVLDGTLAGKTGAFLMVAAASEKPVERPTSWGRTFKRISPNEVRNAPTKWEGRDIEFRNVNVYWVDDNDVRFVTDHRVTLFARDVRGAHGDREFLKANCETEDEALSRKCLVTVRFKYDEHDVDQPTGIVKRTVLRSADVEVERIQQRRR